MNTHKVMKQFVHDLEVELGKSMAIPIGGYGTVEETPIITVPKVLITWMWRYVDEWLEDESEKNKEKYLVELIKTVRDEEINSEVDEEPETDEEPEYDDPETADVDKGDDLGPVSDHPESDFDDVNIETIEAQIPDEEEEESTDEK